MAFYIYEQPAFSMEHFHPSFCRSLRSMITLPINRQWSLMENLSEESNQSCCTSTPEKKSVTKSSDSTMEQSEMEVAVDKIIEPKTQIVSKPFMSKVSCQETMEKVEIKMDTWTQIQGRKSRCSSCQ